LAPPFLFLLGACICLDGGDAPLAAFLVRISLFTIASVSLVGSRPVTIRPTVPDLLLLAFWVLEAASLARGGYPWTAYQWFLHHGAVAIFYLMLRGRTDDGARWPALIGGGIVAIGLFQAAFAAVQFVVRQGARPAGTLVNSNHLAEFLVFATVAAFALYPAMRDRWGGKGRFIILAVPAFLAGIGMTRSRGGILVLAAVLSLLAERRFGWRRTAGALAVALALFVIVPNPVTDRFAGKGDPYAFDRVLIWKSAVRMAAAHPLGVGAGQFRFHWLQFRYPSEGGIGRYAKTAWHPHSEPLSALAEFGIPGALLFAGLAIVAVVSLYRARRGQDPATYAASLILFASGLHSLLEFNYHILGFLLVNAAALALVSGRLWRPLFEVRLGAGRAVRWSGLFLLAVMSAYAAATYAGSVFEARGNAAMAAGRASEALGAFRAAEAVDPLKSSAPDLVASLLLARFESTRDQLMLAEAIEHEMEASIRNPFEYRYHERLGLLYARVSEVGSGGAFRASMHGPALGAYDRAIALNPFSPGLRYRKALLLHSLGADAEAAASIRRLLEDEPRYAKGWALLGDVRERTGDRTGALAARRQALSLRERYGPLAKEAYERGFFEFDPVEVERRMKQESPR
jgi:O-antigen ligase